MLAGFEDAVVPLALELLDRHPALPITTEIGNHAARLHRSARWKLPDALQAALAMRHGLELVTRNTRDFRSSAELRVVVPYRV